MDDMTQLREMRADAPVPDRAALAPGRQRLTDAVAGGRRGLRLRADWRVASIGAAAAITAAALLTTQIGGGPGSSHGATAASPLSLHSPAEVLNRAADALEKQEAPAEPRPDQWIYTRTKIAAGGAHGGGGPRGEVYYEPPYSVPDQHKPPAN
ncbi:hypothetical protein ACFVXE_13620, partial [Streptomyces sp. NPDC058231]